MSFICRFAASFIPISSEFYLMLCIKFYFCFAKVAAGFRAACNLLLFLLYFLYIRSDGLREL